MSRFHKEAAASTAPAALKAFLLVMTTSTGYFHCMNFAQPEDCINCQPMRPLILSPSLIPSGENAFVEKKRGRSIGPTRLLLTPISALPAEVFPRVRHQHHGQYELELLQRLLPFLLRVGFGVVGGGGVDVGGGGRVGEGVDV